MKFKFALIIFLNSFCLLAQEKDSIAYSNTPLSVVINDIEEKYDIKLSFNSELINNRFVTLQQEDILLLDLFATIEAQTNLEFNQVTDRYYILKEQPKVNLSETQLLDEVIIKEYLTAGINEKTDGSINMSPSELGILPGLTEPDILQSLQLIPGVQSPSETASELFIRGGTPDQNLILWDGIKMYHSGHFFGTISAFNPYITDEVKLYKRGTKAKYGSRISGVIDIKSDSDIPDKIKGGLGFNLTHFDAYLKTPLSDKTALLISARRSFTDVFNTPTFKNLSERVFQNTKISEGNKVFDDDIVSTTKDFFYFSDFTIKAIVKPNENNEITFSNLFTKNKLDYEFLIEKFNEASGDRLDIINQGSSIAWKHNYSPTFNQTINLYYSKFDLDYLGTNSITNEFKDELRKQSRIDDFSFAFDTNWKVNALNSFGIGYQFSTNKVRYLLGFSDSESPEDNFTNTNINKNNTHSLYIDYQFKKENKLFFDAGLRANYISVVDRIFLEPRVQFSAKLNDNFRFKASAESLHQAISQVVEVNTQEFGLENQVWILSDDDIFPILKSTQFTAGILYSQNGWNLDIEGYVKNVNGLTSISSFITEDFDGQIDDTFSDGSSNIVGLDFLLKKKIDKYRTWLSYSLIENEFTFNNINNGDKFPGNFDITHHLTWSHTYEWQRFNVSMGWNIRTGIPYTKALGVIETDDGYIIEYDKANNDRLSNYHRLDISTTYKFNLSKNEVWKGKLGISMLNVYNHKNILNKTYKKQQSITDNAEILQEVNKLSLGITPNIVFRIEF